MSTLAVLELLIREAAPVEFEAPVLAARTRGDDPEVIAELERARTLALRVRAILDQRRRREAELSALFETANDLAALREVDAVLRAIVHRARLLLHSDVAYLSLNDDTVGDTYMRVVDGITSAAFRSLRLPMGAGLGGLVAQTATPYTSARYFEDKRFHHTNPINDAVAEEGLVSILGVPLILGANVIGVLYASNRSERPFDRDDVSLLVTLAAHAAIALDNARLLSETSAALAELNNASTLLREHTRGIERAADAHDRFTQMVLRGGDVDDVAASVSEVLGGSLWVLDTEGRVLAATAGPSGNVTIDDVSGDNLSVDIHALHGAARTAGRAVRREDWWAVCVTAGPEHLGTLLLHSDHELNESDQRTFERSALVTALLLLLRRSVAETENRVKGELLDDLLDEPLRDVANLGERARRVGADLEARHTLVVARSASGDRSRLVAAASFLAGQLRGLSTERQGTVVLLLPLDDPSEAARRVCAELAGALSAPVTAGASATIDRPGQVPEARREAMRCVETLEALGRAGEGASAAELGFLGVLLGDRRDVMPFVRRTIGPVLDYDTERGTELAATLEAYFDNDRNLARTREALHIHVNTVTQRLERVTTLLDDGWQLHDRSLEVQIALRLHRISRPSVS
ncbi:MAG TPA: GAF domain-containing protein [Dermatophilaceae bacterium]|nr:GAF domain-containing protein [Dermatophilaceae bacterium]